MTTKTPCGQKCPTSEYRDPLHICEKCKSCLYEVGFKQDMEAADRGYPMFFCGGCGFLHFWD